ncbi:MAG: PAS domain S-box protein [Deltaproteobacteria bacterium]|nr:PAS domain S-box protein [Deltaproteobacteria bacterium]
MFYASKREQLEVLVPFLVAGLGSNELCSWEVVPPLTVEEATRALGEGVPDLAERLAVGQIELVPRHQTPRTAEALERQLDKALLAGFDGLRLVRHMGLQARAPAAEAQAIRRLNVIAAVLHPRSELDAVGMMKLVQDHRFALVHESGRWEVLEGSEVRTVRDALERSEQKLKSLFGNMSEGFAYHRIVLDAEGRPCDYVFLEVNASFERLTGLSAERILGRRVTQVLPGIEVEPTDWIGRYGRVALTGEPAQFESHAAPLDKWFAVSAFSPLKGYFAVTFSDITGRKRAEAERQAAEERLLVTLRSIGDAVIVTDTQGRVTLMNRVAESLTGWSEAEAQGRLLSEVFHIVNEDTGAVAEDPVRNVIDSGCVVGLANHTALVARDGRQIAIADSAAPVQSEAGLLGVVLVFRDVTSERQAEQALLESQARLSAANSQLLQSDKRKDEFLAILSHELRNPLAPITNSLYVLERAAPGGSQALRAREVIDRQVGQLTRLVNDLLDVTRISRNKIQLQRQRLDLGEVVRRSAEDQRSLFDRAGLHLGSAMPAEPVFVNADETRLAQVLGNLLQNAAKFTARGGTATVTVGADRSRGHAIVRVSDTGVGMTPETLAGLFQPFMQADQTLDRTKGGLGLGLALVKGLVELHGGEVSAYSEGLGRGTLFTVRLPIDSGVQAGPLAAKSGTKRNRRRVLIIEDNIDAADTLRMALEIGDHDVAVAHNGPEGLSKARDFQPEVVLCDIGLPGMDGFAVARAFRADEALRRVVLVALSGYAQPEDQQRALEAGFERHLSKPPSLEAIEELLGSSSE